MEEEGKLATWEQEADWDEAHKASFPKELVLEH